MFMTEKEGFLLKVCVFCLACTFAFVSMFLITFHLTSNNPEVQCNIQDSAIKKSRHATNTNSVKYKRD